MAQPRVLILRAPGTNCDEETAHAFRLAGGLTEQWHVNRALEAQQRLAEFQILCVPGGFSYGDDIAAGRIFGNQLQHHLADAMGSFHAAGKLILGICNGFQVLLKTNLLVPSDSHGPRATLAINDSGHFEARWVRLKVEPGNCVFLQGIEQMELPVAHAEGRFAARDSAVFDDLAKHGQLVLRYRRGLKTGDCRPVSYPTPSSQPQPPALSSEPLASSPRPQVAYPDNPNGAMGDVAGVCDSTGRVFGLMPHPERFVDLTQHPRWTREPHRTKADGLRVFQNAVRYFQ